MTKWMKLKTKHFRINYLRVDVLPNRHHHTTTVRWFNENNEPEEIEIRGKPTDLTKFKLMEKP